MTTWNNYPTVEPCPHVHVVPKYQTKDGAPAQPKPIHLTLWFIRCEDCGKTLWSAEEPQAQEVAEPAHSEVVQIRSYSGTIARMFRAVCGQEIIRDDDHE